MSFDLFVWHEDRPITAAEARSKLERWDAGSAAEFAANPAVNRFYDVLLDRFPPLESLSEDDIDRLGVWSMTPERSDTIVVLSCVWSRADEVGAAVQALAAEHGLVCYEPGDHILQPNAPGHVPAFTLTLDGHPVVPDPDERRLEWAAGKLGTSAFVILERADGWFVQAAYGRAGGVPPGTYALKYQEGAPDRHFRCQTTNLQDVVHLLQEFQAGATTWKGRHAWRPL